MGKTVIAMAPAALTRPVLKLGEVGGRVDIEKRAAILEYHFGAALPAGPEADITLAAAHRADCTLAHRDFHQTENRLAAQDTCFARAGHCYVAVNANETADGMETWTANSQGQPTMKGSATW